MFSQREFPATRRSPFLARLFAPFESFRTLYSGVNAHRMDISFGEFRLAIRAAAVRKERLDAALGHAQLSLVEHASARSTLPFTRDGPTPSFLPVRVMEPRRIEGPRRVEIVLEQGRTVRVPAGFDRQTLADVLAVLIRRPRRERIVRIDAEIEWLGSDVFTDLPAIFQSPPLGDVNSVQENGLKRSVPRSGRDA